MLYYRHGGYVFHEDELAPCDMFNPVVVLPLADWQQLVQLINGELLDDNATARFQAISTIIATVEVPK